METVTWNIAPPEDDFEAPVISLTGFVVEWEAVGDIILFGVEPVPVIMATIGNLPVFSEFAVRPLLYRFF